MLIVIYGLAGPCSDEFIIGLHLSPERFGIRLDEVIPLTQQFIDRGHLDFLDMSLWDCFKMIDDPACQYRSLISAFTELDRKDVLLPEKSINRMTLSNACKPGPTL